MIVNLLSLNLSKSRPGRSSSGREKGIMTDNNSLSSASLYIRRERETENKCFEEKNGLLYFYRGWAEEANSRNELGVNTKNDSFFCLFFRYSKLRHGKNVHLVKATDDIAICGLCCNLLYEKKFSFTKSSVCK